MGKLLEVKEFDIITSNSEYKEHDKYKYLPKKSFDELIEFIHEFAGDDEETDVLKFMRIGYKRNIGEIVSIRNYVGLIQLKSGDKIQILPKISLGSDDEQYKTTKKVFIKMLRCMKEFQGSKFNSASLSVEKMNIYEIFINMYLQEVRKLVKKGIKSDYVQQEDNLKFFKGKLQVAKHLRQNMVHKERFYVSYDEYHPNRAENKLLKATLLKLQKITTSAENSKEIRQLLGSFEMVDASTNYQKDFSKIKLDRNTKDYEMLMQWSKVFLTNKSFSTFEGDNKSRALLFPMEKLYESYVGKNIRKVLSPMQWKVHTQHKGQYLFDEPTKKFALRPDIVIEKDGKIIVMDTKWKKLVNNEQKHYGISQEDMYQMYAYSKKYQTDDIWLLYPIHDEIKDLKDIKYVSKDGTKVNVFFVDVENITDSLEELSHII